MHIARRRSALQTRLLDHHAYAEGAPDNAELGLERSDSARKVSETSSASEAGKPAASAATKPKAEANPLASKLGLSTAPRRAVTPPQGRGRGRGRGGRGPGGARGAKVVIPGRGGRPRYSPLMQASTRNAPGVGFVCLRTSFFWGGIFISTHKGRTAVSAGLKTARRKHHLPRHFFCSFPFPRLAEKGSPYIFIMRPDSRWTNSHVACSLLASRQQCCGWRTKHRNQPLCQFPNSKHPAPKKQGRPQHFRPQGRPPAATSGGDNTRSAGDHAGLPKPSGPAASSTAEMVANHNSSTGLSAPNSSRGGPATTHHNAGTPPFAAAAATTPTTAAKAALAHSPIVPHRIHRNNTSGQGEVDGAENARLLSGIAGGSGDCGPSAGVRPRSAAGPATGRGECHELFWVDNVA